MQIELQDLILKNLVQSEDFNRRVFPFLTEEYFTCSYRPVYDLIREFVNKFNKLPTSSVLGVEFKASKHINRGDANDILTTISNIDDKSNPVDIDWLTDQTETWCKERAISIALFEAIDIAEGKNQNLGTGAIPDILTKALSVSFDSNIGHDYLEGYTDRFNSYHVKTNKIPFAIDILNKITKGGVSQKTLNIILGGTNVGKSLVMCDFAASYLMDGHDVLYITMEMSEEKIAERIDANILDVPIDQLEGMPLETFRMKIDAIKKKTMGRLIIKEYPTSNAHAGHFRALLRDLALKKKFFPKVIFIDYINICSSSRVKMMNGANSYTIVKTIAEEIRGLAVEFKVPIWSATQVTRAGFDSTDVDLTDTAESFGLPATADLFLAIMSNDKLEQLGQYSVKQLKNRYADKSKIKRFVIGVDKSKMRLYDVEDSAQNLNQEEERGKAGTAPVVAKPFSNDKHNKDAGKKKKFGGLKV